MQKELVQSEAKRLLLEKCLRGEVALDEASHVQTGDAKPQPASSIAPNRSHSNTRQVSLRQQTTARSHSLLFKQGAIAGLWSDKLSTGFCIFSAASAPEGRRCGRSSIA